MYLQRELARRFSACDKLNPPQIILGLQLQMGSAWKLITKVFNEYPQK